MQKLQKFVGFLLNHLSVVCKSTTAATTLSSSGFNKFLEKLIHVLHTAAAWQFTASVSDWFFFIRIALYTY